MATLNSIIQYNTPVCTSFRAKNTNYVVRIKLSSLAPPHEPLCGDR
jgi:hypothetical protein